MKTVLIPLLAALLAGPALAAPVAYNVDANHTFARFSYRHLGFTTQQSRFNKTTGSVVLDAEARTASVDITIDMKSVDTGSAEFDEHIQRADLLDTERFPYATFKSTWVKFEGNRPVAVDGILTIKGISQPVTLTVTSFTSKMHPMLRKDAIGADASTVIKRSDFNAGKYAPFVGDEVTLTIVIEAQEP